MRAPVCKRRWPWGPAGAIALLMTQAACFLPTAPPTARVLAPGHHRPYISMGYPAAALAAAGELDGVELDYLAGELGYRYGLRENIEVGARLLPWGLGGDVKYQLRADERFALSAGAAVDLWSASSGSSRGAVFQLPVNAGYDFTPRFGLFASTAYRLENDYGYTPAHALSLSTGARIGDRYGLLVHTTWLAYVQRHPEIISRDPYRRGALGLSFFYRFPD